MCHGTRRELQANFGEICLPDPGRRCAPGVPRLVARFCGFLGRGRLFDGAQASTSPHDGLEVFGGHLPQAAPYRGQPVLLVLDGLLPLAESSRLDLLARARWESDRHRARAGVPPLAPGRCVDPIRPLERYGRAEAFYEAVSS
jgi:hypothetical protein